MLKEVKIEITNFCLRNCKHCSSEAIDKKDSCKFLDKDLVKKIILQAHEMGASSIVFTGGEPTLHPDLMELIRYAKKTFNMKTKLYTMCYRNDKNFNLLNQLNLMGLDEVIYSTVFELVVSKDESTYTLEEFISRLSKYTNLKIGFHHVVTNETIDSIERICSSTYNVLDDKHRGNLSLLRYVSHGRGDDSLLTTSEQNILLKERLLELKKEYDDYIRIGSPYNILNIFHTECNAADETMIIGFDGNAYPCDAMKYFDYMGTGGNIYEKSLQEIYNSDYFNKIRNLKNYYGEQCQNCNNFTNCKGGCLAQKMIYHFNDLSERTFAWYEFNARRTMNNFETKNMMKLNAKTGIVGETGELVECVKKLYTHNYTDEKKDDLKKLMFYEIGDIIWYIASSLSSYHQFSMEELASYMFKTNSANKKVIDDELIKNCAMEQDPMCEYKNNNYHLLSNIDDSINKDDTFKLDERWEEIFDIAVDLVHANDRNEVIKYSALLMHILAELSNQYLKVTLEEVMVENIRKLQKMYPSGFDSIVAGNRLDVAKKYKLNEEPSEQQRNPQMVKK